jgi:hypothetical protein
MKTRSFGSAARALLVLTVLAGFPSAAPAAAQPRPLGLDEPSASDTRERLRRLLAEYPPAVAEVLRLDPSLLSRADYLSPYPALGAFVAQHPEIARSPVYFLGEGRARDVDNARFRTIAVVQDVMFGMMLLTGFTIGLLSLGWVIRTGLADRRWQRLTKTQTDAHTKLLDRLASHEDLLTYIQSPVGKRFLDAAPIPLDEGASGRLSAPIARILLSVQAGIVLAAVGIGLFVAKNRVIEELASPLSVVGLVAVALGVGFIVSAIAAYSISQRLGLLRAPDPHDA